MRKLVTVAAGAGPRATAAAWCTAGGTVAASALPARLAGGSCDRADVVVTDGAAAVRLPSRGMAVSASVQTTRGAQLLTVARAADGSLTVRRGAPLAPERTAASGCTSSAFVDLGYQVSGTYRWRYNAAGAPANVAGAALANLKTATANITSGKDDCGITGKPRTGHAYAGATSAAPGITTAGQCGSSPDQVNITGWKSLTSSGTLAVTCTFWFTATGNVADSDAAINNRFGWATAKRGCRNAWDLQGVMTHERGHTYGLGHPAAIAANNGLTMYPSIAACDFSKRTLGRGDMLGLFSIYGQV